MNHELTEPWTFYYILSNQPNPELNGLHKLGRFESAEQFWDLYRNIKRPSAAPEIEIGLFSKNFKLDKTDPVYKGGGILAVPIPKDLLDIQWERLIMSAIGSNLDRSVAGVSTRFDKEVVWIWCKDMRLMDFVEDNVVDVLGIDDDVTITRTPIQ